MGTDDKNVFITSYNQSGGITAHTVNLGPQKRKLDERFCNELKRGIPLNAKVQVKASMNDPEAIEFGDQIDKWLRQNGYSNVDDFLYAFSTPPVRGVLIQNGPSGAFEICVGSNA